MANEPGVSDFCQELYDKSIRSPYLLAFIVDMYEETLQKDQGASVDAAKEETLKKATEVRFIVSYYMYIIQILWNILLTWYVESALVEHVNHDGRSLMDEMIDLVLL